MSVYRVGTNKSSINNFPSIRPSLDLDFANTKALDPRITFTRSSGGSYVGADGILKYAGVNEARFDHNPVTGESLGLLIEDSRTNLFLQSVSVDTNNGWTIAPNTTRVKTETLFGQTATIYQGNGSSVLEFVRQQISVVSGVTYTVSVYARLVSGAKPTGGNLIIAETIPLQTTPRVTLPYSTISLSNTPGRFSLTFTAAGTGIISIYLAADQNNTAQISLMGAQVEQGAFPTSYIPTTTSSRTRAADNASITGTNFSSWYNQTEGTIVAKTINRTILYSSIITFINNNLSGANTIRLYNNFDGFTGLYVTRSTFVQTDLTFISTLGVQYQIAASYKENNFAASFKGGQIKKNNNGLLPKSGSINRAIIGILGNDSINGTISRLTYYPKSLPPSQLQALTR